MILRPSVQIKSSDKPLTRPLSDQFTFDWLPLTKNEYYNRWAGFSVITARAVCLRQPHEQQPVV